MRSRTAATASSLLPFITYLALILSSQVSSQSLPHVTITPSTNIAVSSGRSQRLDCTTNNTNNLSLTYQWRVNGNAISSSNTSFNLLPNNSLHITQFSSVEHNGNYSCIVTNGNWTITSHAISVQGAYIQLATESTEVTINVKRNDYIVIDPPNHFGYPSQSIVASWDAVSDNGVLRYTLQISNENSINSAVVGGNGSLYLRRVTVSQRYRCRLSNALSTSYIEHTTIVNVSGAITDPVTTALAVPHDVVANEGETIRISCIASGSSIVSLTSPVGSSLDQYNAIGLIHSFSPSDEGIYSCNITGTPALYTGSLTIRAPPIIVTHPSPFFSINYGSSTTLSCSATGNNNEWAWFHNGVKIGDTRTVTVATAGLQDSGGYQCFVSNPAGVDSRTTSLIVETVPPAFTTDGQLTSKLGFARENLTLRCNATGAPLPGYEWRKEGSPLNANNADFAFPSPGTLVFNSLNSALQGNYTCIAKSMIDTDTVIGTVNSTAQVFVAEPTIISSTHLSSIAIYNGESFALNCSVTHDTIKTSIRLHWTLNGTTITNNTHTSLTQSNQAELSLRIMGADMADVGHYQCHARTSYNDFVGLLAPVVSSESTTVIVTNAPIKPSVTGVSSVSPTVLEVTWIYDGFSNNVDEFRLEIQGPDDGSDWSLGITVSGASSTRANITALLPFTYYFVRVDAVLRDGRRITSDPHGPARTLEDVPSEAPQSVKASARSKNAITLNWEPPKASGRNGIITDYTVSYWASSRGVVVQSSIRNYTLGSNITTYVLTGLSGSNTYWISIAAHTSAGIGLFSPPINETTDSNSGGTNEGANQPIHRKTWFIFFMCFLSLMVVALCVVCVAALRWNSNRKGHKYPVGGFHSDEVVDFSKEIVNDYDKRRKPLEPIEPVFSDEGGESESSQATIPQSLTHAMYAPSTDSVVRRGMPLMPLHHPLPPSYINPPSFEDSMKQKLSKRRSASMSLLEKAERMNFGGSGWSVGHDPKSGFYHYDEQVDSDSIDKTHLHQQLQDDLSGGSSDSRLQSNPLAARSGSLATFV